MILSYGWTWPAFVARKKTVTRRDWSADYAPRWRLGTRFDAYDRSPRFRGQKIGEGILTAAAYMESLENMPDADYAGEGFEFLAEHLEVLPKLAREQLWGSCTREGFQEWRESGESLWVVRFKILSVESDAMDRLRKMMEVHSEKGQAELF